MDIQRNIRIISGIIITLIVIFAALIHPVSAHAAGKWNGPVQVSFYTLAENGPITASGYRMTESSLGVAVPMQTVVSKNAWKRGSVSFKKTHFYYGEKIKLKHGKYTCVARVVDCGGFGSCGCYYKGIWRKRLFDLQPAVKRKLHCGDVEIVKWAYMNTN